MPGETARLGHVIKKVQLILCNIILLIKSLNDFIQLSRVTSFLGYLGDL